MPALNITFTDSEHAQIVAAAEREGAALKTFVRDAALARSSDYRRQVEQAAAQVAAWSAELNVRLQ